jgi:serine/threonine protein kinase
MSEIELWLAGFGLPDECNVLMRDKLNELVGTLADFEHLEHEDFADLDEFISNLTMIKSKRNQLKKGCRSAWKPCSAVAVSHPGIASAHPPPQATALNVELKPGNTIERYTIVRVIRISEKSKVFRVSEESEEYVLKQVKDPVAFAHEVKYLQAAKEKDPTCSHIVKYIRSFKKSTGCFIVTEAGGETAAQWRESCGMPVASMLLKMGPDLLNAVEFLHTEVGLIHCDIKLTNLVMFPGPKKFKLVDIGAAQREGEELCEYTIANLPPEAAQCLIDGQSVKASVALDIWASGMSLLDICNPQWLEQILPEALDKGDPASEKLILQTIANSSTVDALNMSAVPHSLQEILHRELLCINPDQRADATTVRAHNFWQGNATVGTKQAHKKMTGNDFVPRPWHFSAAAKEQAFDTVDGCSHQVRIIYKLSPNGQVVRDVAFAAELNQLFEAFNSTSDGAVEIVQVEAIKNRQREQALEAQLVQWQERMEKGGAFAAGWVGAAGQEAKQLVFADLSKRQHDNSGVLAFAGLVDGSMAPSICSNGFAVLNKTDDGYFSRGVYVTFDSAYAAIYGGGIVPLALQESANEIVIIAVWAAVVNPYPITRGRDYTRSEHECDLLGGAVKGGYDSHFVLVNRQGGESSLNYQACADSEAAAPLRYEYSELVLKDEAQVMARFVLRCRTTPSASAAKSPVAPPTVQPALPVQPAAGIAALVASMEVMGFSPSLIQAGISEGLGTEGDLVEWLLAKIEAGEQGEQKAQELLAGMEEAQAVALKEAVECALKAQEEEHKVELKAKDEEHAAWKDTAPKEGFLKKQIAGVLFGITYKTRYFVIYAHYLKYYTNANERKNATDDKVVSAIDLLSCKAIRSTKDEISITTSAGDVQLLKAVNTTEAEEWCSAMQAAVRGSTFIQRMGLADAETAMLKRQIEGETH